VQTMMASKSSDGFWLSSYFLENIRLTESSENVICVVIVVVDKSFKEGLLGAVGSGSRQSKFYVT